MTWFFIPNSPDLNLWEQKGRRSMVLSPVSYSAPQLKPPHVTAPIMFWRCCSVFLPQKTWNFMGCQESEPVGSYCVTPSSGCDQAVTKRSAPSNISRPANLRARETHRERFFIFCITFCWEDIFSNRKMLSISIQLHFLSISGTVQSDCCARQLPWTHVLELHQGFFP